VPDHHSSPETADSPNASAAPPRGESTPAAAAALTVSVGGEATATEPDIGQAGQRMQAAQAAGARRFDSRRTEHPHADPHAAYGPDHLRADAPKQPTALAHGRRGRAAGTRSDRFNVWGVWFSVGLALLACAGAGVGIILVSWPLIVLCVAALAIAGGLAWAFGILNDTR